jgi:hypothetical protein
MTSRPLGDLVYARSGDKGGDANVGVWIPQGRPDEAVDWLLHTLTEELVRELLPETESLRMELTPLPNLRGLNILVRDMLGEGVAASTRFDPQGKAIGEWLRSRYVDIPDELLR